MAELRNTFGVLDTDRSPKLIEQGSYTYAINIRNAGSAGQQIGEVQNIKGNKWVQLNLPAGTNTCIGHFSDLDENYVYYFLHNNLGQHQVIRYNWVLASFQIVLRTPELKFNINHYIVEANVVEGQLFFNDTFNEVRRLDITECIGYLETPVWDFTATVINGDNQVQLDGATPPPFAPGQNITIVREWRQAWIDHNSPDEDAGYAAFNRFDPNPEYSDTHQILAINGNSVILQVAPTGVQDFLDYDGQQSFIGGKAYLFNANRAFTVPIQEKDIKLYRENPPYAVDAGYGSDESRKTNNLRGKLFQFKTRYVYPNGMRSVPSPICKIPLPRFEKNIPFQDLPIWQDNYIGVRFDTGRHDVVAIELLARESSNPVDNDWSVVKKFDKDKEEIRSNTSFEYRFYGDEVLIKLPVPEGEQPMDYIPHKGGAFCFIRDKRNAIGSCDEGFDHVDVDVDIENVGLETLDNRGVLSVVAPQIGTTPLPTTETGLPVVRETYFPLNRDLYSSYLTSPVDPDPYWRSSPIGDGPVVPFNFNDSLPFPDGWQSSVINPSRGGGFTGLPNDSRFNFNTSKPGTYPWLMYRINIFPASGEVVFNDMHAPGAIIDLTVSFRMSKHLVWHQQVPGFTPSNSLVNAYVNNSLQAQYGGVLSFETFEDDSDGSFVYFSANFTKVLTDSDTSETVRDYFIDQIQNSPDLQGEVGITLSTFTNDGSGGPNTWFTKTTTVNVSLNAATTAQGGFGANGINSSLLFVLPEVSVAAFNTDNQGNPATIGAVSLSGLASWYQLIGMNQLRGSARVTNVDGSRGFKTGASHLLAIEYRDEVGRRATVSPADLQYVPYFNENPAFGATGVAMLFRINNPAPLWATHYQFMYAGNMSMLSWLQFEINWIAIDDDSEVDGIKISLSARINRYNKDNNDGLASNVTGLQGRSNVAYSWSRGDRLRFITYWQGNQEQPGNANQDIPAFEFVDMEIIGEGTDTGEPPGDYPAFGTVIIVKKQDLLPYIQDQSITRGSLIEVYTPKDNFDEDQVLYYEIGETFKVTNQSHHGNRRNQGPNTPGADTPYAEVLIKNNGDAFAIGRRKIRNTSRSRDRLVESSWFSDFYPSQGWGPGTVNRVNFDARRQERNDFIRYSDFLVGDRNGLNRYFDGNLTDQPNLVEGKITRMECPDMMLYVFQEDNTGVMPVGMQELLSAAGTSTLMRSDQVLGQIRYIEGRFGIGQQREALIYFGGTFYFPCVKQGMYLALTGQSFVPISRLGRDEFWQRVSEYINLSRTKVRILSAYDREHNELIVHVPNVVNTVALVPEDQEDNGFYQPTQFTQRVVVRANTQSYSPDKKGWVTEYSYNPECLGSHNNKLLSWKGGQFYIHNETESRNSFYVNEIVTDSRIKLSFNNRAIAVKFLRAMATVSSAAPKEVIITTDYGGGQRTSLFADDFQYMENQYFSNVLQNELTPGVDNPIIEGDDIRGEYFEVELVFDSSERFRLFAVSLEHGDSEFTIKPTQ